MAVTSQVIVQYSCPANGNLPAVNGQYTLTNATGVGQVSPVTLTTSPASIPVPVGSRFAIIIPASANTVNIIVGGATSATLDPVNPSVICLPATSPILQLAWASGPPSPATVVIIWL